MTQEKIDRLFRLRDELYDVSKRLRWMEDWGKELYDGNNDRLIITASKITGNGRVVFQRDIEREDVECEYQAEMAMLLSEKERIEKEIEQLRE